jgi:hypothetical protein
VKQWNKNLAWQSCFWGRNKNRLFQQLLLSLLPDVAFSMLTMMALSSLSLSLCVEDDGLIHILFVVAIIQLIQFVAQHRIIENRCHGVAILDIFCWKEYKMYCD